MADEKVAELLYEVYAAEIHAIGQYIDHHARCADMGYAKLAEEFEKEAQDEMKHAEQVLERLLFLEAPVIYLKHGAPEPITDVPTMLAADLELERNAIDRLNAGIKLCFEAGDHGTRMLLEELLSSEEEHFDSLRRHLDLIKEHGKQYLLVRG